MEEKRTAPVYRVWTPQKSAQDPMELPALVALAKSNRIQADTWIYVDHQNTWAKASTLPELKMFFGSAPAAAPAGGPAPAVKPATLRRIKIFSDMDDQQLEAFIQLMESVQVKQFDTVVREGDHGDAMFLVLEGELRARGIIDGRETTFTTMTAGEFFGEISLLDQGPRSVDVVANQASVLLKISADSVAELVRESPQVVAPFLYNLSRSVVGRVRTLTKKYEDSIHFARLGGNC